MTDALPPLFASRHIPPLQSKSFFISWQDFTNIGAVQVDDCDRHGKLVCSRDVLESGRQGISLQLLAPPPWRSSCSLPVRVQFNLARPILLWQTGLKVSASLRVTLAF